MSTSKLCSRCSGFFAFTDTDSFIKKKTRFLKHIQDGWGEHRSVGILRNNLNRYQEKAESRANNSPVPCPWDGYSEIESIVQRSYMQLACGEISYLELKASSIRDQCRICRAAVDMIEYQAREASLEATDVICVWYLDGFGGSCRPRKLTFAAFPIIAAFEIIASDDQTVTESKLKLRKAEGDSTRHESCLDFLSKSLDHCLKHHELCSLGQNSWVPTRLLDLGSLGTDLGQVRLVETGSGVESPVYLTLSHMWGTASVLKLVKSNYSDFMKGLRLDLLPQRFIDSVYLARRLKLRYLWIDSLCIIQDDADDWARESSTMHQVYRNGICNIAACSGLNPTDSLFTNREPDTSEGIVVENVFRDQTATLILIPDWVHPTFLSAPLYKRGWVVQERLLCQRLIQLAKFPFWECQQSVWTEIRQSQSDQPEFGLDINEARLVSKMPFKLLDTRAMPPCISWWHIIEYYSRCKLTVSSDKLIAIGSLAKSFSKAINQPYLAGLWGGDDLIKSLLWDCPDALVVDTGPTEYRAPSWSWASVDHPVDFWRSSSSVNKQRALIHVTSYKIVPKSHDPFGQILYGEIVLRGFVFETNIDSEFILSSRKEQDNKTTTVYALILREYAPAGCMPESARHFQGIQIRKVDNSNRFERVGLQPLDLGSKHTTGSPLSKEQWLRLLEAHSPKDLGEEIILV
ncbi:HET-domain-containing protein [Amniculicola lignicola CBS 123094]|uniref:HET-domain-containing protein n=1 Tax=Amniculicola lignicola CBS 123094 TaxID=1392246 RepID=A0A6A5WXE0_9PLEO|nr:HET-domain-containing protein [Amniculicola lignicola CBS 123094]